MIGVLQCRKGGPALPPCSGCAPRAQASLAPPPPFPAAAAHPRSCTRSAWRASLQRDSHSTEYTVWHCDCTALNCIELHGCEFAFALQVQTVYSAVKALLTDPSELCGLSDGQILRTQSTYLTEATQSPSGWACTIICGPLLASPCGAHPCMLPSRPTWSSWLSACTSKFLERSPPL